MKSWFLMLKKILSTILLIHPFLLQSLKFSQGLPNMLIVFQAVLSFQTLFLGVMTPHVAPVVCGN